MRADTFKPRHLANTFSSSSLMPSLKYSFSGSRLRFANASTAIDFAPVLDASAFSALGTPGYWRGR